jgi:hypothetical protein
VANVSLDATKLRVQLGRLVGDLGNRDAEGRAFLIAVITHPLVLHSGTVLLLRM